MIVIDGKETELRMNNFGNLQELLVQMSEDNLFQDRVVTDVLVNKETFSEIYPHQAEDMSMTDIESVEIVTMAVPEMAVNITRELYKVVRIMHEGASSVSELFRRADDAEALELFQDLLDVIRDFLGMVGALRDEFSLKDNAEFAGCSEELTELFSEMIEVTENEDWILLADLLEYEFMPAADKWKKVIANLREDIREASKAA
jgi:hypothetical protein